MSWPQKVNFSAYIGGVWAPTPTSHGKDLACIVVWIWNIPHRFTYLNTGTPILGPVWEGYGTSGRLEPCWSNGVIITGNGLWGFIAGPHFLFSTSASCMWIFPLPHYLCHYVPYLFWNGSKINPLSFSSPTHFFCWFFFNHSNRKIANRCKVVPQRGERPVMRSRRV